MKRFGIFETVRVENGKPVLVEYHYERLKRSSQSLGITLKIGFREFEEVVRGRAPKGVRLVRFTLYRSGNFEVSDRECLKRESVSLIPVYSVRRNYSALSEHKVIDIMDSLFAFEEARRRGGDEALLFNSRDFVSETAFANIFFYKNGILFTPSLKCGCLRGTRREFIREVCREMGLPLIEGYFGVRELLTADEVFITSSREDTCPVERIGNYELRKPEGKPLSKRIREIIENL